MVSAPWYLGLAFRTRAPRGVLMQVQAGPHCTLLCQVCLPDPPDLQPPPLRPQHTSPPGALALLDPAWPLAPDPLPPGILRRRRASA